MTPSDDFDFGAFSGTSPSTPAAGPASSTSSGWDATPADPPTNVGGWGYDEPPASAGFEAAGPPVLWMWMGVAVATVGIVLVIVLGEIVPLAWVAWALCGPVAIGLFSVFALRDTKQRAKPFYGERTDVTWIYRAAWVLAFAGIILAALRLADWVGRL